MYDDALRHRPLWLAIGYVLVVATAWGSLAPHPPPWAFAMGDKLLHAATYALLTFWFGQLYPGWRRQLGLAAAFTLFGAALEVAQAYTSVYRHFDLADAAASAVGTVVAWGALRTRLGVALVTLERRLAART